MICPYCNVDIEPIELNGKMFCSNCGLAINMTSAKEPEQPEQSEAPTTNVPPVIAEPTTQEQPASVEPEIPTTPAAEDISTPENDNTPGTPQNSDILMNILDNQNMETSPETPTAPAEMPTFDESVKNIDNLGTAGILLDILSNEQHEKAVNEERSALEAAEDLVDKITVNTETPKGAERFEPQGAKKLLVDVLDDSAVNPVIHPELEAGPTELDLPLPKTDPIPTLELKDTDESAENLDSFDILLAEKRAKEQEEVEKQDTEIDSLEQITEEVPETIEPQQTEAAGEEEYFEEEVEKTATESVFNHKENLINELMANPANNNKSEHLKNYFSSIIKIEDQKPSKKGKKAKSKTKKKKTEKKILSKIVFSITLLLLVALLGAMFFILKPTSEKNTPLQASAANSEATFETKEPIEVPAGYVKSETMYDDKSKTFTIIYKFVTDEKRKLIYHQTNSGNLAEDTKNEINKYTGAFEVKVIDKQSYTIFDNGTIVWGKENFVYSIEVVGESFKDLVEKMALSVR